MKKRKGEDKREGGRRGQRRDVLTSFLLQREREDSTPASTTEAVPYDSEEEREKF